MAVGNLTVAIDPECVVIGGGIAAEPSVLPGLTSRIRQVAPFPPRVETATFGDGAALVGALAMAVDAAAGRAS
jgi:glucokinase